MELFRIVLSAWHAGWWWSVLLYAAAKCGMRASDATSADARVQAITFGVDVDAVHRHHEALHLQTIALRGAKSETPERDHAPN